MTRLILNDEHLGDVLFEAMDRCRHRLLISTADVKDVHLPPRAGGSFGRAESIVAWFRRLGERGVQIHLLHSGVPSGPMLEELKRGVPPGLIMRRCCRVHAKAVIADGRWMYLGSANLTGAGLGAKSARRRNFEAGVWTDDIAMIDPIVDLLEDIFEGGQCDACGRRDVCPVPLEEPFSLTATSKAKEIP
jgi:phosphatidylserine/phosphatidylglycerophosphate/cardiolipin synthase-like enzyme